MTNENVNEAIDESTKAVLEYLSKGLQINVPEYRGELDACMLIACEYLDGLGKCLEFVAKLGPSPANAAALLTCVEMLNLDRGDAMSSQTILTLREAFMRHRANITPAAPPPKPANEVA